jgi:hypothetical protein
MVDFMGGSRFNYTPQLVSTLARPLGRAGQLFTELILQEFDLFHQDLADGSSGLGLG